VVARSDLNSGAVGWNPDRL